MSEMTEEGTVREKAARSEQELVAMAIHEADPGGRPHDWETMDGSIKDGYMRMAEAAVRTAMPPLPEHQGGGVTTPTYPAELLDKLAEALAFKLLNPQQLSEGAVEALDRYQQEVGRENVPELVAKAVAEL
jgi:hypothetical protein